MNEHMIQPQPLFVRAVTEAWIGTRMLVPGCSGDWVRYVQSDTLSLSHSRFTCMIPVI